MQDWVIAGIGVVGTLAGTGLGYRGALSLSRRDRKARLDERIRAAFGDYLGALYVSVAELRDVPPRQEPNWLDKAADAMRGEAGAWVARRRSEYRLSGDRYRETAGRLGAATAVLQVLPLHPELRAAVDAANEYIKQLGQDRTPELKAQWSDVHARLMAAIKTLGTD